MHKENDGMEKRRLRFLAAAILAAVLFGGCFDTLDPEGFEKNPVEYDVRGNRLVRISVGLSGSGADGGARAVTKEVAQNTIDLYEVVFQDAAKPGTYYSATGYKGVDKQLILKIAPGDYYAVLFAGKKETGENAVLLAADIQYVGGTGGTGNTAGKAAFTISSAGVVTNNGNSETRIKFALTDLDLAGFGTGSGSTTSRLKLTSNPASGKATPAGAPAFSYYSYLAASYGKPETATFNTNKEGVFPGYSYGSGSPNFKPAIGIPEPADIKVEGIGMDFKDHNDKTIPGFHLVPNPSPAFSMPTGVSGTHGVNGGELSFGFTLPSVSGVTRLGFDIGVYAFDTLANRNSAGTSQAKTIKWHIRNGLDTHRLDTDTLTLDNTGAGILITVGDVPGSLLSIPVTP
jgi:hypothetical protein